MSDQLPSFYETEFATNWEMKVQQMDARLVSAVTPASFQGKRKWFNQLAVGTMTEVTDRKGVTPDGDTLGDKYWMYRRKFEFIRTWDEDDQMELGSIALPDSDEISSFSAAENRTKDAVIIQAFDATRYIGADGVTTNAFDSNFSIAVDFNATGSPANCGLTVEKVLHAKKLMDTAEVPDGDRYFACSAQQLQDMLLLAKATSRDYVGMLTPLVDGTVDKFAGFNFRRTEQLTRNTSTDVRTCFAWHKTGIKLAENGRDVHIDVLPTMRHAKQLRGVTRLSAVRTQNEAVVRVYCDESP